MKKLQLAILAVASVCATSAWASLTVSYTVDPVATVDLGNPPPNGNDTLALTAGSGILTLQDGIAQTAAINGLVWYVGDSPIQDGTSVNFTLSRNISLNAGGSTVIQQGVDVYHDYVNHLSITPGSPLVFSFAAGTVTVTPIDYEADAQPGVNYYMPDSNLNATFLFTAVPEPTTMIAGALLLLPFGASTIRILRKKVAA